MLSPLMVAVFSRCSSEVGSSTTHGLRSATPSKRLGRLANHGGEGSPFQVGSHKFAGQFWACWRHTPNGGQSGPSVAGR